VRGATSGQLTCRSISYLPPYLAKGNQEIPQSWVAKAVLKSVASLPNYPNLNVLDLSCGEGEILASLHRDGCQCCGTHYCPNDYIVVNEQEVLQQIQIKKNVDLTKPLPFDDSSYDVVIMSEVIEHLPSHIPIVAEVARVLKPNGYFVFSTPNIHRLQSRWQFFLTGTHKLIRRRIGWDLNRNDIYAYHISPVDLPMFHTLLHQSNLHIRQMRYTRIKFQHAFWLLFYPLFWLIGCFHFRGSQKNSDSYREGEHDLRKWMLHPLTLINDQFLFIVQQGSK